MKQINRRSQRINAAIADVCESLRVAYAKLGLAIDEFDSAASVPYGTTRGELLEAKYGTRVFGTLLADMLGDKAGPTVPSAVFAAIREFGNTSGRNPAHVEGSILALMLAERSLHATITLLEKTVGHEGNAFYQASVAARGTIHGYIGALDGGIIGAIEESKDDLLDRILVGKNKRNLAAA